MSKYLVVGLGQSGQSILRFLKNKGAECIGFDTRKTLANLQDLQQEFDYPFYLGEFPSHLWSEVKELVVSPGLDLREPFIIEAKKRNLSVIGDIELFYREAKAPIIAITGTNAKSTVTTLVTEMINASGKKALMGGNIGIPALDLLKKRIPDYYILELSSFQLDLVNQFKALVGIVLNITPDHLDRHGNMEAYIAAKDRIYKGAAYKIVNQGVGPLPFDRNELSAGLAGEHNLENARNALAIIAPLNLPLDPQYQVLKTFKGLPHRCVLVSELAGVAWYNDSKGTNVGATLAAIKGIGAKTSGKLVLLLGGVAKDQDFKPLRHAIESYVRTVIIYGQDVAPILKDLEGIKVPLRLVKGSFAEVLNAARQAANAGDAVLFSPACASYDMFKHFEDRGEQFTKLVQAY